MNSGFKGRYCKSTLKIRTLWDLQQVCVVRGLWPTLLIPAGIMISENNNPSLIFLFYGGKFVAEVRTHVTQNVLGKKETSDRDGPSKIRAKCFPCSYRAVLAMLFCRCNRQRVWPFVHGIADITQSWLTTLTYVKWIFFVFLFVLATYFYYALILCGTAGITVRVPCEAKFGYIRLSSNIL